MTIALQSVFNLDVVKHIHSFRVKRDVQWEEVETSRIIYETKHITTREWHGCGVVVYFHRERKPGWYRWVQLLYDEEPTYRFVHGIVAVRWIGDVEYMAVLPNDYDRYDWDEKDDDSSGWFILSDYLMRNDIEE